MIDLFSSPSPIYKNHNSNDDNIKCKQMYKHFLFPKKIDFDNSHTTKSIFPNASQEEIRIPSAKQEIKEFQDPQLTYSDKNLFTYGLQKSQVAFNILVAGSQGVGKTTFVDVLLNKKPISRFSEGSEYNSNDFQESMGVLEFENQVVYLNIFDTKGFQKNNSKVWFKTIRHFINSKFKTQIRRNKHAFANKTLFSQMSNLVNDERIHLCFYFLSGSINEDLLLIQKLSNLVNVIPILARGDQYTKVEVIELKQRYNTLFAEHKIDLFDCLKIDDEQFKQQLQHGEFEQCSPFMIISSTSQFKDEKGRIIQGRQYPWGYCDPWNPQHSDLSLLYKALIGYYMYDLIQLTDFYQHSYIKRKQESQKKIKRKTNFFNQILLHINQILYLID